MDYFFASNLPFPMAGGCVCHGGWSALGPSQPAVAGCEWSSAGLRGVAQSCANEA